MIHSPGFAPPRPIDVALGLAPVGPKGFAVARELADTVILTGPPGAEQCPFGEIVLLANGTVLGPGEDHHSPRVVEAAGAWYAAGVHSLYEWAPGALPSVPGGAEWGARIEAERPDGERHLAVHEGHLVTVTDRDRPLVDAAGERLLAGPLSGAPQEVAARLAAVGAAGVTEVAYSPSGPDIARELEAFAAAARQGGA